MEVANHRPSNLSCLTLPGEELLRPPWLNQSPHFRNPRHVAKGDVEAILPNLENPTERLSAQVP